MSKFGNTNSFSEMKSDANSTVGGPKDHSLTACLYMVALMNASWETRAGSDRNTSVVTGKRNTGCQLTSMPTKLRSTPPTHSNTYPHARTNARMQ